MEIVATPAGDGRFTATFEGRVLGTFRCPLFEGARVLMKEGFDGDRIIALRHARNEWWSLKMYLKDAAASTILETRKQGPGERPYVPFGGIDAKELYGVIPGGWTCPSS